MRNSWLRQGYWGLPRYLVMFPEFGRLRQVLLSKDVVFLVLGKRKDIFKTGEKTFKPPNSEFTSYNLRHTIYVIQFTSCNLCHTIYVIQFTSYNLRHTIYVIQFTSHNLRHTIYVTQFTSHNLRHTIYVTQFTSYNLRHTIYVIQFTSHNLRHTISTAISHHWYFSEKGKVFRKFKTLSLNCRPSLTAPS
jgi:hypothetical protein